MFNKVNMGNKKEGYGNIKNCDIDPVNESGTN